MGRKGKYSEWLEEEKLVLLESWARDGCLDVDIAERMGINVGTLYAWKRRFPQFDNALKKGKEVVDVAVENALLKRALGYQWMEQKAETFPDGSQKVTTTVKEVPGDVTAQIYWLKNRKPEQWRDRPSSEKEVTKIKVELIDSGSCGED